MDSQPPTSFIPKKTFSGNSLPTPPIVGTGVIYIICLFLFVVSLIAAGGAFGYQAYLTQSIANKSDILTKDQGALDFPAIEDLVRLDTRIVQAKSLLANHVAPSAIFTFLSQETLQNVQFVSFKYDLQPDGSAAITLDGVADSFSTVALQSDQLSNSQMLKNIIFTNLNTNQNGQVTFTIQASVIPSLLLYSSTIGTAVSTTSSTQMVTPVASSSNATTSVASSSTSL